MLPPTPAPIQSVFNAIEQMDQHAIYTEATRKNEGITYTPVDVAREMVILAQPRDNEVIHEPACGRGVFVFALVEHWLNQGRNLQWIANWAHGHLRVGDTDAQAVADLKDLWLNFFAQQGVEADPLHAVVEDGLFGALAQERAGLVLGNPPYVRVQHLPETTRADLRAKYPGCAKGNVDLYYAFFEDALRRADRVCYIMPNSWLSNASAKKLRAQVLPRLSALIDFGSRLLFAPVRAYTAIVVCEKQPGSMILVRNSLPHEKGEWQAVARTDARWGPDRFNALIEANTENRQTLNEVAVVVSGIATLADHAFTLPSPERFIRDGAPWVRQVDPLDGDYTLEVPEAFAPRILKATKIRQPPEAEGPRILCPYDAHWKIIDEKTLDAQAPDLLKWLNRRRAVLDGRDKGKTHGYEAWYAYGRRQGFWTAEHNETVVLMPQMGNGALTCVAVNTETLGGRFLFTSGFILRRKPGAALSLEALAEQLRSPSAWAFVKREGKAWAGAGDYMTLGARALRRLPLN
jgi:hypothetical protein